MSIRPIMRKNLRLKFLLLSTGCLLLAFTGRSAFALASDCVEDDPVNGRFICFAEEPLDMRTGPCENTPDLVQNQRAWCEASGGVFNNPDCPGSIPYTEEDIPERSLSFLAHLTNSTCSIVSDT